MAPPQVGFQSDPIESPFQVQPPNSASPEVYTADAVECVDDRRLRRRISNRESARRSRARKQRYRDELRDGAALLERWNRELVSRVLDAHGRLALVRHANASLRTEAAALSRRLAAARSLSVVCTLPRPLWPPVATGNGACSLIRFVDIEQTGNSAREINASHDSHESYVAHEFMMHGASAAPCVFDRRTSQRKGIAHADKGDHGHGAHCSTVNSGKEAAPQQQECVVQKMYSAGGLLAGSARKPAQESI
ncbi:hypothetical protein BS78_01G127400 [Paspalum vaginatum]|nr:hypothetical protein BS78_01G127400 [Paspalum vaginatum]